MTIIAIPELLKQAASKMDTQVNIFAELGQIDSCLLPPVPCERRREVQAVRRDRGRGTE